MMAVASVALRMVMSDSLSVWVDRGLVLAAVLRVAVSTNSVHLSKPQCSIHVHARIFTAEYLRKFDNGFRNMDCLRPAGAASMPANDPLPVAEPATANAVRRARSTAAIEPQGLCGAMGCRCRIGPPGIGRGPGSALEQALTAGLELGLAVSETSIRLLDARLGNALGPDAPDAAGAGRIQLHRCPTPPDRHRLPGAGDPSRSLGRANADEAERCV